MFPSFVVPRLVLEVSISTHDATMTTHILFLSINGVSFTGEISGL